MCIKLRIISGFSEIEKRDVSVSVIKINRKQSNSLKQDDCIKGNKLWGATIVIDNNLKNPVLIGQNNEKVVYVNNKWVLTNISENEKRMILEDNKESRRILKFAKKQQKEYKKQYEKYLKFKKQLEEVLLNENLLEKFEFVLDFTSKYNKLIPQG